MEITVVESVKGKFGPQLKDSAGYLGFGKFYKGETVFAAGTVLEADVYTSPKGNRYINEAKVKGEAKKETAVVPTTDVEKPVKKAAKEPLGAAEKDSRILAQGLTQAVISSEWYAQQAALTDLSNKDSVKALREFAKEEVEFWMSTVKDLAGK